ncbi:hypothetical protein [Campylobacter showae]|nr:hypothetical protein [Campylobacter showae]
MKFELINLDIGSRARRDPPALNLSGLNLKANSGKSNLKRQI